jgi:outer membrane protein assembly factor BamB
MPFATGTASLIIGLKGTVVAVDRQSGETVWSTHLKGSNFVTVAVEDGAVFAATGGRLYRLDPSTGDVLWSNDLPGLGFGIVSIAGESASAIAEYKRRQDASHSSAGA